MMAKQKIEIEVDIPDGYEFVRYGVPVDRDLLVSSAGDVVECWGCQSAVPRVPRVIVREAWQWPEWLKADYIAMDRDGDWYAHRDMPMRYERFWVTEDSMHLDIRMFDFTPPPCDDWKQSLRVRPGVEKKGTTK